MEIGATYISQFENGHRGIRWHTPLGFLGAMDADLRTLGEAINKQQRERPSP
jgi:hypothetical protein